MTTHDILATVRAAVDDRFEQHTEQLAAWVRIPSCAFPGFPSDQVHEAAQAAVASLQAAGLPEVRTVTYGATGPAIIATDHRAGPTAPTVLLYAHYDVQPPLDPDLWHSPAYEPTIRNGRLFGRGAADDKAGLLACMAAVQAWYDSPHDLPVNVTIFWEGEEEIGSPHLGDLLQQEHEQLRADAIVVCDLVNIDVGVPSLTVSLRGMACGTVTVNALQRAAHSGMWGGVLPDAASILTKLLSHVQNDDGTLNLPGITTPQPPTVVQEALQAVPITAASLAADGGLVQPATTLEPTATLLNRLWCQPVLIINSIAAGDPPQQAGNVLVPSASARLGIRLPPGMDAQEVWETFCTTLHDRCPPTVELHLEAEAAAPAWSCDPDDPMVQAMHDALSAGYGRPALQVGNGATIPFVEELCASLVGAPALLLPVEDPQSNAHGPDESVHLGDLAATCKSLADFLGRIA
jgi:acetylornithine deacetylase/succinyl-diaminopimelate desuccinylase-like protein